MRVFISWSGAHSKSVATALQGLWRTCKWALSHGRLATESLPEPLAAKSLLRAQDSGIRCHLRIPQQSEERLGAIRIRGDDISGPESRLCPYLIDIKSAELSGPLSAFQSCEATEGGTWNLVSALNQQLRESKSDQLLKNDTRSSGRTC